MLYDINYRMIVNHDSKGHVEPVQAFVR